MRNFSTEIDLTNSFSIGVDVKFTDQYFLDCQNALVVTMDANPSLLNPSEEAVLADFIGWFMRTKEDDLNGRYPQKPAFFYVNLNTGHNCLFVATNMNMGELMMGKMN